MAQSSRTFRIFVSSTFSDLKAERNALQEKVFPRLRDLAAAHGCRFQAIDLRWGVSEEAALDQQTMKICLGEIERCQKTSPRPNFIILLGNRYGWRPVPYEIPFDEFEKIVPLVSKEEKSLLEQWYRRDDNAVPLVYCLQPRSGEFVEYEAWEKVENSLRRVFLAAIAKLSFSPDTLLKYTASATEQEIVAGAMQVPDANEHVFGFFREIEGLPEDERGRDFRDADKESARNLARLKKGLKKKLSRSVHIYKSYWKNDGPSLEHLDQLCKDVYADLSKVILNEIDHLETEDPLEREITAHANFCKERAKFFVGRDNPLKIIADYTNYCLENEQAKFSNEDYFNEHFSEMYQSIVIWGKPGSGKSALMAKAIEQTQEKGINVIFRFIGATPESSNGRLLLQSLCRQISRMYDGDESSIPSEYTQLVEEFPDRLRFATAGKKPLVIFLDALDQLSNKDPARHLTWLPKYSDVNYKIIVSTLPGDCLQALKARLLICTQLEIPIMSTEEGEKILDLWLTQAKRKLQELQQKYLLSRFSQCGLPLYLKLAFEEARLWRSYDPLPALRKDIPGILRDLFKRLSQDANHGSLLVSRSLEYLAASKNGLSEDELLDILSRDKEVLVDFQRRSPKSPQVERLPVVIWSRLYLDLEPYLMERIADNTSLLAFYHATSFNTVISADYLSKENKSARNRSLAEYFGDVKRSFWLDKEKHLPDLRKTSELVYQQIHGRMETELKNTLTTFDFLHARLIASDAKTLIEDYDLALDYGITTQESKSLRLLRDGLRLSAHILAKDTSQLASQLFGRMSGYYQPDIQKLLEQADHQWTDRPWLRPLSPCFDTPGGPLIRTLAGHTDAIYEIALTSDERRIISRSYDKTLKIWDLESGECLQTLMGHKEIVSAMEISPDGKRIISGSEDNTIGVWSMDTGKCILDLRGHTGGIAVVAITPDGDQIISGSRDHTIRVWDSMSGKKIRVLHGHKGEVGKLTLTPDGRRVISSSDDQTLKVWDLKSGECIHTIRLDDCVTTDEQAKWIRGNPSKFSPPFILTPDGKALILGSDDCALRVWNLENGICIRVLRIDQKEEDIEKEFCKENQLGFVPEYGLHVITLAHDGKYVISESDGLSKIRVWDLEKGICKQKLRGEGDIGIAIAPDDKKICMASPELTIKVKSVETGECIQTLSGHHRSIFSIVFTSDSKKMMSASGDGTIKVWDMQAEENSDAQKIEKLLFGADSISVSPDGSKAISLGESSGSRLWDVKSGKYLRALEIPTPDLWIPDASFSLAFVPKARSALLGVGTEIELINLERDECIGLFKGHIANINTILKIQDRPWIISGSKDKTVKVWDINSRECILTLAGHADAVTALAFTPDGKKIISGSADHTLRVWDTLNGECIRTFVGHADTIRAILPLPNGKMVLSGSDDTTVKVWDMETGSCIRTMGEEYIPADDEEKYWREKGLGWRSVSQLLLIHGCRQVVSGGHEDNIKVWDVKSGECLYEISHSDNITAFSLLQKGTWIVTGSRDNTIKVWDLESRKELTTFIGNSPIKCLAVSPDGRIIIAGDYGGYVYFLELITSATD